MDFGDNASAAARLISGGILTALGLGVMSLITGWLGIRSSFPGYYADIEHFKLWAAFGAALGMTIGIALIVGVGFGDSIGGEVGMGDYGSLFAFIVFLILFLILWAVGASA